MTYLTDKKLHVVISCVIYLDSHMKHYAWQDHCVLKRCSIPMKPKHYTICCRYTCSKC